MSAQRASGPARLAAGLAALVLVAVAAAVALRLIGRREPARPSVPVPPPEGRVVDLKERVRHQEFREGRLVAEVRGDAFFLGPDGRNHLRGSIEVVRYGPGGEAATRLTADEVVYDKGGLVFTVAGRVRAESGGVVLEGDSFEYDEPAGLFSTRSGGVFSAEALRGEAREVVYAEGPEEIRLGGGFRVETGAAGLRGGTLTVSGGVLTYALRERRGRVEGKARLEGGGFRGSAAAASFVASEDESALDSAVLEGDAEAVLDGKETRGDPGLETRAGRINVAFSRDPAGIALETSGGSRFAFRTAPDEAGTVLAPSALLNHSFEGGRLTWQAWGGVKVETTESGLVRVLEGEEAVFDGAGTLGVRGRKDRPAAAEAADFQIEAAHILFNCAKGDVLATGGVSGVLKGREGRRKAGFFSDGEDVAFSCQILKRKAANSTFLFTGAAMARQGEYVVRAEELETEGETGRMSGRGGVEVTLAAARGAEAPPRAVVMGGEEMAFRPDTRTLSLAGKASVRLPEAVLEAGRVSAVIPRAGDGLGSLAASGGVTVSKGDYRGRAEAAFYEAAADRITLTGGPVLTDGKGGSARGDKLTFDLADDKILVENEGPGRSATVIRS